MAFPSVSIMPFITALFVYPVKSCRAIAMTDVLIERDGLQWDRRWMVVDAQGNAVSQREYPSMARIEPTLGADALHLRVDGAGTALTLPFETPAHAARVPVSVWSHGLQALDEGDDAARWFSDAIGAPVRLVRFADDVTRLASRKWTKDLDAPTRFNDEFPLLVTAEASLADLNGRLGAKGVSPLPMSRFRPNVVLGGTEAFDEDFAGTLSIGAADGDGARANVVLRAVKPCARCQITTLDQSSGLTDPRWPHEPLDTLAAYRANPKVDGGLTFGQNAIVVEGVGRRLRVGDTVELELDFGAE
jgi:uncharacterized protein YcbX